MPNGIGLVRRTPQLFVDDTLKRGMGADGRTKQKTGFDHIPQMQVFDKTKVTPELACFGNRGQQGRGVRANVWVFLAKVFRDTQITICLPNWHSRSHLLRIQNKHDNTPFTRMNQELAL
jgi:hypothetical protein